MLHKVWHFSFYLLSPRSVLLTSDELVCENFNQSINQTGKVVVVHGETYILRSDTNSPNWRVEEILYGRETDRNLRSTYAYMKMHASRDDLSGHLIFRSLRCTRHVCVVCVFIYFLLILFPSYEQRP